MLQRTPKTRINQADCCKFVDLVTREEQLPSLYALLQYLMQVPKLDGETLPEFTDVPPCFTRKSEIVLSFLAASSGILLLVKQGGRLRGRAPCFTER